MWCWVHRIRGHQHVSPSLLIEFHLALRRRRRRRHYYHNYRHRHYHMCAFVSGLFAAVVISILTYTRVLTPASSLTPPPSHLISPLTLTPYPSPLTLARRPLPFPFWMFLKLVWIPTGP